MSAGVSPGCGGGTGVSQTSDTWATLAENFLEPVPRRRHVYTDLSSGQSEGSTVSYQPIRGLIQSVMYPPYSILHTVRSSLLEVSMSMTESETEQKWGHLYWCWGVQRQQSAVKANDGDVGSDLNHHDIMASKRLLFTYISCLFRFCGRRSDISCQHPTINIPQRMRRLGVTKQSKDNWD